MQKILFLIVLALFVGSVSAQKNTVQGEPIDFTATDMYGKKVSTADLRGKVVVLNLWFINCPNCLSEIKALNQIVEEYKNVKDVVFLAPAASPKRELEAFLKKYPFNYQVLPDSIMMIIMKFGTPSKSGELNVPFPMHYVLDRNGNTIVKVQGTKGVAAVRSELARQFPAVAATTKP
ncbi:MAG: TlpA family protein disulfide reductase [Pyrinomonadaceae bacterium]|nr:TlpA family protein disulfide reductase [Acidobacteriota bacterium]MBK7932886.1 TlpA family protein disulfide reductase [Acidobacteriota bacterium]MBP7375469.1 TlpA family protein disulfide reductase [Pyrinomonadaceae bacterium]